MKFSTLCAGLALAVPLLANAACERLNVTVMPLGDVPEDFTVPYAALQRMAAPGTIGLTMVTAKGEVDGCDVTLGYGSPIVYIAREVAASPCMREHVLRHEREHVRFYRENLLTIKARMERHVGLDTGALLAAIRDELRAAEPHHNELDSPEEYAGNNKACAGALRRLLR